MNEQSSNVIEKHSRILRWSHWLNVPLLFLMIWSGILIYWAHQAYIKLPDPLSDKLGISFHLAEGMGWHFFIMWPLVINGIIYTIYIFASGQWRNRFPDKTALKNVFINRSIYPVRGIYNDAQRIAYSGVLIMGIGSLLSGLAIYKPVQLGWLTAILGGYEWARFIHFVLMILFILFFFVHIIQVARAGWNNLRSMIAGYEIEK